MHYLLATLTRFSFHLLAILFSPLCRYILAIISNLLYVNTFKLMTYINNKEILREQINILVKGHRNGSIDLQTDLQLLLCTTSLCVLHQRSIDLQTDLQLLLCTTSLCVHTPPTLNRSPD